MAKAGAHPRDGVEDALEADAPYAPDGAPTPPHWPALAFLTIATAVASSIGIYHLGPALAQAAPGASPIIAAYREGVDLALAKFPTRDRRIRDFVIVGAPEYDLVDDAIGSSLLVAGRIANQAGQALRAPAVSFVTKGPDGRVLQRGVARLDQDQIEGGDSARYVVRVRDPLRPIAAVEVTLIPSR